MKTTNLAFFYVSTFVLGIVAVVISRKTNCQARHALRDIRSMGGSRARDREFLDELEKLGRRPGGDSKGGGNLVRMYHVVLRTDQSTTDVLPGGGKKIQVLSNRGVLAAGDGGLVNDVKEGRVNILMIEGKVYRVHIETPDDAVAMTFPVFKPALITLSLLDVVDVLPMNARPAHPPIIADPTIFFVVGYMIVTSELDLP